LQKDNGWSRVKASKRDKKHSNYLKLVLTASKALLKPLWPARKTPFPKFFFNLTSDDPRVNLAEKISIAIQLDWSIVTSCAVKGEDSQLGWYTNDSTKTVLKILIS
jgi:hypothetical protein